MAEAPRLTSLTMDVIKAQLLLGDDMLLGVYELPSHLFNALLMKLPPLSLLKLQTHMPFEKWDEYEFVSDDDYLINGRKRGRNGKFNAAWKALFKLRWPKFVDDEKLVDWDQMYWQMHLQDCLDEAAELALIPSFDGRIGELKISDGILKYIGYEGPLNCSAYSKLSYHCQQFGKYARCLRLQSVFCVAETCSLLSTSKLHSLTLRWIRSKEHVDGLCKLLIQNCETLRSIEFLHCKLSSTFINTICSSLNIKSTQTHGIEHFSMNTSSFLEKNTFSLPLGLASFLSSGRSLSSLKFCSNHLEQNFARMLVSTLIDAPCNISSLDLSDNDITGWLSNFNWRNASSIPSSLGTCKSLQSLRVLNIRGNNLKQDDAENLRYALTYMPNLEILDISDNFIEDEGIRCLLPYFAEASENHSSLAELYIENCELSCDGVTEMLETLFVSKRSFNSLSLADNSLGSRVAGVLGKLLGSSIKLLNIEDIGLGPTGFEDLRKGMMAEMKLVNINISKNRGGIETAKFLSKLISMAPALVTVNASYNFMPVESLDFICSSLKAAKGSIECLNLTGNYLVSQSVQASMLADFQHNGRPIVILPLSLPRDDPYDDEP